MTSALTASGFRVVTSQVPIFSNRPTEFVDVTEAVAQVVRDSGIQDGLVTVFSKHTTAGIAINEAEPLLLDDMCGLLDRFAPRGGPYRHDDLTIRTVNLEPNERANGHAHCQRLFIPASENIPLVGGELQLGRWQRVFFVELDGARPRQVTVQVMGA